MSVWICSSQKSWTEHRAGRRGGRSRQGGTATVNTKPPLTDVLKSAGPGPPAVCFSSRAFRNGRRRWLLMSVPYRHLLFPQIICPRAGSIFDWWKKKKTDRGRRKKKGEQVTSIGVCHVRHTCGHSNILLYNNNNDRGGFNLINDKETRDAEEWNYTSDTPSSGWKQAQDIKPLWRPELKGSWEIRHQPDRFHFSYWSESSWDETLKAWIRKQGKRKMSDTGSEFFFKKQIPYDMKYYLTWGFFLFELCYISFFFFT